MIAVIDYGAGNLQSVLKALRFIGCEAQVINDRETLLKAGGAILPGVGSFGDAMDCLNRSGLREAIDEYVAAGKPFLGICLGLQLLFEESEESPGVKGLGLLPGKIVRIPNKTGLKIPHMGWNSLALQRRDGLFRKIEGEPYVYFVHSYYLRADRREDVSAIASYGVELDVAVQHQNLYATQFHPEKSGNVGLKMLKNFAAMTKGE